MPSLAALWLPILLSAVIVFVASSIIHMATPWHKSDYPKLPNEDRVLDALRPFGIPPGSYMAPMPSSMADMRTPEFEAKRKKGPVVALTVFPPGPPGMGKNLTQWFVYSVVVGIFSAYVTSRAVPAGATYMQVFRFAGVTAFLGYALALWQGLIWQGRPMLTTVKGTIDGLLYALLTAGTFGWLWPR